MYNLNTPIWQLTVGEFIELQQRFTAQKPPEEKEPERKRLVYGIKGLSELLHCSTTRAQQIRSSGIIDKAITQYGRKLIIDADLALKLMEEKRRI